MKFKQIDPSMSSIGFITGLAVGIVVGTLFMHAKSISISGSLSDKQTDFSRASEIPDPLDIKDNKKIADHLAFLGSQAEPGSFN